jgi:hypothetical protein
LIKGVLKDMGRVGKLEMRKEGLFVDVEIGLSELGFPLKLSDDTKERIHMELLDGLDKVDREDELWQTYEGNLRNTISEME